MAHAKLAIFLLSLTTISAKAVHRGFIRMQDGMFVDQECREFNFVGANGWRWSEMAANELALSSPGNPLESTKYLDDKGGKINPVLWAIRELQKSNVTVVRMFAGAPDPSGAMIVKPGTAGADGKSWPNGVYNRDVVNGLDKVIGWCRAHGIKVILSFIDNWSKADSKTWLLWAAGNATGTRLDPDDFYTDKLVKDYYKNFVSYILNHVNKETGLQFKEDPTILGYNLMNEPRCNCQPEDIDKTSGLATSDTPDTESNCANIEKCFPTVQAWVKEMAAFVKGIAPKQLLGVGDEGFATFLEDADSPALVQTNPGDWASLTGDSLSLQSTRGIDYYSTHMWVDDWGIAPELPEPYSPATSAPAQPSEFSFHRQFLEARMQAAKRDRKPFVIEEFGKYISRPATSDAEIAALRDPWINDIVQLANKSQADEGTVVGVIVWKYGITPYHNNTDKNWITVKDTTWTKILAPTGLAYNFRKTPVPNCRPATGLAQEQARGISMMAASGAAAVPKTDTPQVTTMAAGSRLTNRWSTKGSSERPGTQLSDYVSHGHNMMATQPGLPVSTGKSLVQVTESPHGCAASCGQLAQCTAFHYNPVLQECQLVQGSGTEAAFSSDGWESYWQEDIFDAQ